ncbi:MAG: hypothetical protein WDZ76_09345 [Pseudohongiellaceae bacterium]
MGEFIELFGVMMAIFVPITMLIFVIKYMENKRLLNDKLARMRIDLERNNNAELEKEVQSLRERVEVLEQIVTDTRFDLHSKIQSL